MPTNHVSRVCTTLAALILALWAIFGNPSKRWWEPGLSLIQRTTLHPGIDMVGGTRLIYAIQLPDKPEPGKNYAEETMQALKRRVDPDGLRNLVWRPQGANRLEIQMPLSPEAAEAPHVKEKFDQAKKALDATNISQDAVVTAIEKTTGAQRDQRLSDLAEGDPQRTALFKQLTDTYDKIQALRPNPNHLADVDLATQLQPLLASYDDLKSQIESTNLTADQFLSVLDEANSPKDEAKAEGQKKIDDLRKEYAGFTPRLAAMDAMSSQYKDYDSVKMAITGSEDLEKLLQGSGVLEFHILADTVTCSPAELQAMKSRLGPNGKGPLPQPGDTIRWMEVDHRDEFDRPGYPQETTEYNGRYYMPVLVTPLASMDKTSAGGAWGLQNSSRGQDPNGGLAVDFNFNPIGGKLFGDLTTYWHDYAAKINPEDKSRLAIVLDNKVISAPNLQGAITGGNGQITGGQGGYKAADAEYLIDTLNAGSLPAQLSSEPISVEQVGPSLGADNLNRGLVSCAFGLIVIAVFLVSYYYLAGVVATFAVFMNVLLILGVMAGLQATFTLPSIAGIVLTIGTAVDANVLIFERLREEQHKGLPLKMALRNSYNQAQSAIIDSNMTSAITSLCLYLFGSEEVKGFGLTLLIGIVASLFTALYVTKTIFAILIDKGGMRELGSFPLSFPKWDRALKPNWDWMAKAKYFYTFSIIMITWGMILFGIKMHQGKMWDIEFATGTSVQVKLKHPMEQEAVRKIIEAESAKRPDALPAPSVVSVGSDKLVYEIVTPQINRDKVRDAIMDAMEADLELQVPSQFAQVGTDYGDAIDKSILPIKDANFSVDGYTPPGAAQHVGGVAIVLRNINPPISLKDIDIRITHERLSSSVTAIGNINSDVEGPSDPDKPTSFAIIIGSNPSVSYNADQGKWGTDLAQPLWDLTGQSINRPPSFEKETNFDPQVAGEMQRDAAMALAFSIIAIMVYIWVRFGNMKYATATVVALLHDTIFTLAAMGFAQYIDAYWKGNFLGIEAFRINLTVVAGVLTIMGYSMIDTIVVFDRIRENRGRYGHLNRQVINDAINQTLSRTLLTCGTTIVTVSFMYFLGGAGIHGFTFVLLVGILVGTYSSVAIAAPMLLWGGEESAATNRAPVGMPSFSGKAKPVRS